MAESAVPHADTPMASSLLTLLDDIATVLDDVAVMTKVATKKTAGVLGDDLALNAQQVSGVSADRELPVVWAVAKGSFVNKAILVPSALAISTFAPWGVTPLMMAGGAFLCYEGTEKVLHRLLHSRAEDAIEHAELVKAVADPAVDLVAFERGKIRGAIRTDFILSAEIIVITLGTVAAAAFWTKLAVLVGIALIMTVGVYGFVALIVKLDDVGLNLTQRASKTARAVGRGILRAAPWLMKFLMVAGTAAMFLVGGGILTHSIEPLHHAIETLLHGRGWLETVGRMLADALVGLVLGAVVLGVVELVKRVRGKPAPVH
jgi:uncharacterized protein